MLVSSEFTSLVKQWFHSILELYQYDMIPIYFNMFLDIDVVCCCPLAFYGDPFMLTSKLFPTPPPSVMFLTPFGLWTIFPWSDWEGRSWSPFESQQHHRKRPFGVVGEPGSGWSPGREWGGWCFWKVNPLMFFWKHSHQTQMGEDMNLVQISAVHIWSGSFKTIFDKEVVFSHRWKALW